MIASIGDRSALGAAQTMRGWSAFLNDIAVAHALSLPVAISWAALAAAARAPSLTNAMSSDRGHDRPDQLLGQKRTNPCGVVILLRPRRRREGQCNRKPEK